MRRPLMNHYSIASVAAENINVGMKSSAGHAPLPALPLQSYPLHALSPLLHTVHINACKWRTTP